MREKHISINGVYTPAGTPGNGELGLARINGLDASDIQLLRDIRDEALLNADRSKKGDLIALQRVVSISRRELQNERRERVRMQAIRQSLDEMATEPS